MTPSTSTPGNDSPDIPIQEIEFSIRVSKRLEAQAITTLNDLSNRTESELLAIPGFGKGCLFEVKRKLSENGMSLKYVKPSNPNLLRETLNVSNDQNFEISTPGSLTAAKLVSGDDDPIVIVSAYSPTGVQSAHRIVSDLASLVDFLEKKCGSHRIIVAGDFNVYLGYGLDETHALECNLFFERMKNHGFVLIGPKLPNGLPAVRNSDKEIIPKDSTNVATHHTGAFPINRRHQIDYVFASKSIAHLISAKALNTPAEWGISDHCRILIELQSETDERSMRLISWNLNQNDEAWFDIASMFWEDFADIALVQEAKDPKFLDPDKELPTKWIDEVNHIFKDGGWSCGYTSSGKLRRHSTALVLNKRAYGFELEDLN